MVTLDTNIVIYFLKGDEQIREILIEELRGLPVFVSVITETELLAYPSLTDRDEEAVNSFLEKTILIPVDSRVARLAAMFRRRRKISLGDGLIAATAVLTQTVLLSRNVKDFQVIPELRIRKV